MSVDTELKYMFFFNAIHTLYYNKFYSISVNVNTLIMSYSASTVIIVFNKSPTENEVSVNCLALDLQYNANKTNANRIKKDR